MSTSRFLPPAATAMIMIAALAAPTAVAAPPRDPGWRPTIPLFATIADAEHAASTYVDGVLTPESAGYRDLLTVGGLRRGELRSASVEVSNSVTAPPEVLALAPDGRTAYVLERLAGRKSGDTLASQLAPGRKLTTVDLADPARPKVVGTVPVAATPEALAVSPDGRTVALVANSPTSSVLQLLTVGRDGRPGPPRTYDLAELGLTAAPGGDLATQVQWHPSGRYLAVNITDQNRVGFFELRRDGTLVPWGAPVRTGTDPFVGRFTPDGRYYLTANWGRDLDAGDIEGRLPDVPSTVQAIRLASPWADRPVHRPGLEASTDRSSEGLAISPDGRLIATVNMRGTALPPESEEHDRLATVSLLRFDPRTGRFSKVGDYPLDGVLPEGGSFDATGRWFLATVYEPAEPGSPGSGLQLYRVLDDNRGLQPDQRLPLPHGTHHVVVPQ